MHPTSRGTAVLPANSVEWELLPPNARLRLLVDIFDIRREDACFHVGAACCKKDIVGVPINGEDGRTDGLLELLGDPPIALGIKRTDCDRTENRMSKIVSEDGWERTELR